MMYALRVSISNEHVDIEAWLPVVVGSIFTDHSTRELYPIIAVRGLLPLHNYGGVGFTLLANVLGGEGLRVQIFNGDY